MFEEILPVLVISSLSLVITIVLFKYLDSFAEGKGVHIGATLKYGGGLAGFVIVTSVLLIIAKAFDPKATNVEVNGGWDITFTRDDGGQVSGSAVIVQRPGERDFHVSGEVNTERAPGYVSFTTMSGTITGREIVFVYINSRGEEGLAKGVLLTDKPDLFTVSYFDSVDSDVNDDAKGRIEFIRK